MDLLVSNKDSRDQVQVQERSSTSSFSSPQQLVYLAAGTMDGRMDGKIPTADAGEEGPPGSSSPPQQNHQLLGVLLILLAAVPPAEASRLGTLTLLRGTGEAAVGLYTAVTSPGPTPCPACRANWEMGVVGGHTCYRSDIIAACKNTQ